MRFCDIIEAKKHGKELRFEEIEYAIMEYTKGNIPDYQMSAFLMAVYFQGMTEQETAHLTHVIAHSGDVANLSPLGDKTVDKHSTGGVGDKTTLVISPIVAACGGVVAKMSGRGLSHTGGTIDKLESIPGFSTDLSEKEFIECVKNCGVAVISANSRLAPADKVLYALRDVTSTVDSIPLIASSIMGKKIAAGCRNIVLDVKFGSGAFMKTPEDAETLARAMVDTGKRCGRRIKAVISNMDAPLGKYIGNFSEVEEAVSVLKCRGDKILTDVCLTLSGYMLSLCHNISFEEGYSMAKDCLDSGRAFEKFKCWINAQGGDYDALCRLLDSYREMTFKKEVFSEKDGHISKINTEKIGLASLSLGGGRATKDSVIDPLAGIYLARTVGDYVKKGELIGELYSQTESLLDNGADIFASAIEISPEPPKLYPHIYKVI